LHAQTLRLMYAASTFVAVVKLIPVQYHILHREKVLRASIAMLRLAISDQNLELLPDYEQRIAVLKDLRFIDENSTVLLKGRVACEARSV
jgi:antiviral helicase SKI2